MLFSNEKINEIFLPENMNYFLVLFLKHYIIRSSSETQIPLKKKKEKQKEIEKPAIYQTFCFPTSMYLFTPASYQVNLLKQTQSSNQNYQNQPTFQVPIEQQNSSVHTRMSN